MTPWKYRRTSGKYLVRSSESTNDIIAIQELRRQTFGELPIETISKINQQDSNSHYVLVFDQIESILVGSYRLTSTVFAQTFESSEIFDLAEVLSKKGQKLELSYACVLNSYRNGPVIRLLLSGVRDYCRQFKIDTIFGCASLPTGDKEIALKVYDNLKNKRELANKGSIAAPLLKFYAQIGALVLAPPLFDLDFNCFDFLMALDLNVLTDGPWARFLNL